MKKRRLWKVGVIALALAGIVAFRGLFMAQLMGGRYPARHWAVDFAGLVVLLAFVRLADWGWKSLLAKALPRWAWARATARLAFLLLAIFPFLMATLQVHPQKIATRGTPANLGLAYEDVEISGPAGTLRGWLLPNTSATANALVAHGLNANRENFLEPARLMWAMGCNALIFDFRAHGDSDGRQITLGLREADDVKVARDWLDRRFPGLPMHALGYSMGASAVLTAAAREPIFDRVCVDGTFSSVENVAKASVLHWTGPLAGVIWNSGRIWIRLWTGADLGRHRPVDLIGRLDPKRLLIIHGATDRVIPFSEGQLLHQATKGQAGFWVVEGAGHAETVDDPRYEERLREFFGLHERRDGAATTPSGGGPPPK